MRCKKLSPIQEAIQSCLSGVNKPDVEVRFVSEEIGRELFVKRKFSKGEFIAHYKGDLISAAEAEKSTQMKKLHFCSSFGMGEKHFRRGPLHRTKQRNTGTGFHEQKLTEAVRTLELVNKMEVTALSSVIQMIHQVSFLTDEQYEPVTEDDEPISTGSTKSRRDQHHHAAVSWSKDDTSLIREHFKEYLHCSSHTSGNKGKLPSKQEILDFIQIRRPSSLGNIDSHFAYKQVRTKIFNERKGMRGNIKRNIQTFLQ